MAILLVSSSSSSASCRPSSSSRSNPPFPPSRPSCPESPLKLLPLRTWSLSGPSSPRRLTFLNPVVNLPCNLSTFSRPASKPLVRAVLPREYEPSPCGRRATTGSLVVGLEGPGEIQKHWGPAVEDG